MQWLDPDMPQVLVDPDGTWLDPQHAVSGRLLADPELLLAALTNELDRAGRRRVARRVERGRAHDTCGAIDGLLDSWDEPFEGRVARDVVAALPDGATFVVASSMPIRDVESFAAPRDGVRGVRQPRRQRHRRLRVDRARRRAARLDAVRPVALLGDLCFLHDGNGLLGAADRGVDATFVVVDNDGGGIFSFLPQADLPEHFETLFGTPQGVDLAALARVHGIDTVDVETAADARPRRARRRSLPAVCASCASAPTARRTSPATARSGPRSAIHCVR